MRPGSTWDLLLSYQPRYALLAEGVREGRIPLWADGMLAGFPVAFSGIRLVLSADLGAAAHLRTVARLFH